MDAYGASVAYVELLNLMGVSAHFISTAQFDPSIPSTVQDWGAPISDEYNPKADDVFSLIDVSNPELIEKFVNIEKVGEVVDYHQGYEGAWADHPSAKIDIDRVGSASTMVFERWLRADRVEDMSELSVRLLLSGILSATVKLSSFATMQRDKRAYAHLMMMTDLPLDWPERYFADCQALAGADIPAAIADSSEVIDFPDIGKIRASQLVVADAAGTVNEMELIRQRLEQFEEPAFVSVISANDRQNYIISADHEVQKYLDTVVGGSRENMLLKPERLWLLEEIRAESIMKWHHKP